ncbi:MAG: STAS domain-containing protein [Armatimonadota bacterium]
MEFKTEDADGILLISTSHMDLDASNADEFKKSAAVVVQGAKKVIMDLSNIGFMDSAGLGAILSIFKIVRVDGGQFWVFGLTDEVQDLFNLVRMQRLFGVFPDKESAINASKS